MRNSSAIAAATAAAANVRRTPASWSSSRGEVGERECGVERMARRMMMVVLRW